MSRCQHRFLWPSLTTRLYRSSLSGGFDSYILYRHRAVVYSFFAGHPALARQYEGILRSISLMSSFLLLQQCTACLVRQPLIVFGMGGSGRTSVVLGALHPEYIQNQIAKIRDLVQDRQSMIAWQTVNNMSRRNSGTRAKLKAAC